MQTLVMKFGGTSVENAHRIRSAATLVAKHANEYRLAVVVSALAKTTDQILECAHAAGAGDEQALRSGLAKLQHRHEMVIEELFSGLTFEEVHRRVDKILKQLHDFCWALLQLRSLTPQLLDVALPMGEKMSAHIFAGVLNDLGVKSTFVDAAEILITDDHFGDAAAFMDATRDRAQSRLSNLLDGGEIPVMTGYGGSTQKGQPTTLGRGGSDTSATILGAVLNADAIWIWTDVNGVLSADPRICPDAQVLPEITFAEAIELSYYGAKVIHHKSVRPAMESGIPICIKNSFDPAHPGTKIASSAKGSNGPIKAVTAMAKTSLVTLCARHDLYTAADILGRLFLRLGHDRVDILFSTQSSAENSLGLVLRGEDTDRVLASIERVFRTELKHGILQSVRVERELAVVTVLGETMKGIPGILGRLFTAVSRSQVSVIAATQGASELSISFAVQSEKACDVVKAVHEEFLSREQFHAHYA